ncbi:hypothetical protein OO006_10800 [Prosthecochloris sp. SCSIO W1101]|nr:hypothetical protein [Prosthecochloris sp. SCSIO W1101]UZJ40835.1 hypothetical protein OO006_10800 [Prosthecochloris sp. SCSIO W1101]
MGNREWVIGNRESGMAGSHAALDAASMEKNRRPNGSPGRASLARG